MQLRYVNKDKYLMPRIEEISSLYNIHTEKAIARFGYRCTCNECCAIRLARKTNALLDLDQHLGIMPLTDDLRIIISQIWSIEQQQVVIKKMKRYIYGHE